MTFEESEVSSAKILRMEVILSGKSFIYIKNKSGPYTGPCDNQNLFFSNQKLDHLRLKCQVHVRNFNLFSIFNTFPDDLHYTIS